MKFFKNGKYKCGIVLLFTLLFICCVTDCYAQINDGGASQLSQQAAGTLQDIIGIILSTNMGVLGSVIAPLINVFAVLIFMILYILFVSTGLTGGTMSTAFSFPFPDQIVFNKIPLLDPNFINPHQRAIGNIAGGVIKNMYSSFFVLAVTVFVISALIIGIKLIFSSLAAEKAKYKEMLNVWIMGIVMLFLVHYLLAGMFYLNEEIVKAVSEDVVDDITIPFQATSAIPIVGKTVSKFLSVTTSWINPNGTAIDTIPLKGYGGIVLKFALQGIVGLDLISSIVFLIIIGQTFGLMITYLKRAFMCIFLGLMAPLIVAVDVVQKALK